MGNLNLSFDLGLNTIIQNWSLLLDGMLQTIYIAVASLIFSLIGGMIVGYLRYQKNPILRFITRIYLEIFRIIPLIVWLFVVFFTLPRIMGQSISGQASAILVFTLWGSAEMGEMVKGALNSLPIIQRESAFALGLSNGMAYRYVLLPQAFKRLLPSVINMATRLIKTTSITTIVGVLEIFNRGGQIIDRTGEPFAIYVFIFFFFFILCYPLTLLSAKLERLEKNRR